MCNNCAVSIQVSFTHDFDTLALAYLKRERFCDKLVMNILSILQEQLSIILSYQIQQSRLQSIKRQNIKLNFIFIFKAISIIVQSNTVVIIYSSQKKIAIQEKISIFINIGVFRFLARFTAIYRKKYRNNENSKIL